MRGRRSVVEDYGKESIDESEISIHSSPTSGYVYFKRKSFVCVRLYSVLLDTQLFALCILRLNVLLKHLMRKVQGNI